MLLLSTHICGDRGEKSASKDQLQSIRIRINKLQKDIKAYDEYYAKREAEVNKLQKTIASTDIEGIKQIVHGMKSILKKEKSKIKENAYNRIQEIDRRLRTLNYDIQNLQIKIKNIRVRPGQKYQESNKEKESRRSMLSID